MFGKLVECQPLKSPCNEQCPQISPSRIQGAADLLVSCQILFLLYHSAHHVDHVTLRQSLFPQSFGFCILDIIFVFAQISIHVGGNQSLAILTALPGRSVLICCKKPTTSASIDRLHRAVIYFNLSLYALVITLKKTESTQSND